MPWIRTSLMLTVSAALVALAVTKAIAPNAAAAQELGDRPLDDIDEYQDEFFEEDDLYEEPYYDYDYYDDEFGIYDEEEYEPYEAEYREAEAWWEDHPYYNEDEWYDPTDWFDGNNYEFDEEAYEAYLRGAGYGTEDEEQEVYEY